MIIGITGLAGSGKDTLADILVRQNGYVKVSLADPIKRICKEVFDFSDEQLWGPSHKRNDPDERYFREHTWTVGKGDGPCACCGLSWVGYNTGVDMGVRAPCFLTPRYALQTMGTEWGRNCHGDTWVRYTMRVAKDLLERTDHEYHARFGLRVASVGHRRGEGVVIPDVRFHNEMEVIRKGGGKLVRIKRPGVDKPQWNHPSEVEQLQKQDAYFDYVVENHGSIDDLHVAAAMVAAKWVVV